MSSLIKKAKYRLQETNTINKKSKLLSKISEIVKARFSFKEDNDNSIDLLNIKRIFEKPRDPKSRLPSIRLPRFSRKQWSFRRIKSDKEPIYQTMPGESPELPLKNPNGHQLKSPDYEFFELAQKRRDHHYISLNNIFAPADFNYDVPLSQNPVHKLTSDSLKDDEHLNPTACIAPILQEPIYQTLNDGYEIPIQIRRASVHLYENIEGKNALYDNAKIKTPAVHILSKNNNSEKKSREKILSSRL